MIGLLPTVYAIAFVTADVPEILKKLFSKMSVWLAASNMIAGLFAFAVALE
jgi:hypothetical protein